MNGHKPDSQTAMERIRELFFKMAEYGDSDWEIFSSKLVRKEFPKEVLVLKAGQTENYLSFIENGVVRYFIPKPKNDITFGFSFDDEFECAYESFLTRTPSPYSVGTLAPTTLWRLTYEDLQDVYQRSEKGNLVGRLMGEYQFLKKARRELSLLNDTAEERYLKLFKERPNMLRNIPLKYIASYIGVTPQALSRIRRRIS
ncbi:MAG: Crp/Fnr family transcriptional regulator [Candidatus Kryptoniota bacterium]